MSCNKTTYITQEHFSSCDKYLAPGEDGILKLYDKQSYMYRNRGCAEFDDTVIGPTPIPTIEVCGETQVSIAHNGEVVEEYRDKIVTWTYDCFNESWSKVVSYKDIVVGDTVTSTCDPVTGQTTYEVTTITNVCEGVTCGANQFCDGTGTCQDIPLPYTHPCEGVTLSNCEFCDGNGDIQKIPYILATILCENSTSDGSKVIYQLDCNNNPIYKNLDGSDYTGDVTTLGECCCTEVDPCVPDCTCAATTPIGMTCPDGCDGTCNGTMMGGCTPNCPETDTYCPGEEPEDGCGGTCPTGTKTDCTEPTCEELYYAFDNQNRSDNILTDDGTITVLFPLQAAPFGTVGSLIEGSNSLIVNHTTSPCDPISNGFPEIRVLVGQYVEGLVLCEAIVNGELITGLNTPVPAASTNFVFIGMITDAINASGITALSAVNQMPGSNGSENCMESIDGYSLLEVCGDIVSQVKLCAPNGDYLIYTINPTTIPVP